MQVDLLGSVTSSLLVSLASCSVTSGVGNLVVASGSIGTDGSPSSASLNSSVAT